MSKQIQDFPLIKALVTHLSHDGRGIAQINGKTTFIENALPGEEVEFKYTKRHSRYDEAEALNIIHPSPNRIEPGCPFFSLCGGCSLQHMSDTSQIQLKQHTLLEQLHHIGRIKPKSILSPVTGPVWGYRTKARLGVRFVEKKQKLLIGFREKNSRFLADISSCKVLHPSVGMRLADLREFLRHLDAYRSIPQIEVAVGENATVIILRHTDFLSEQDKLKIAQFSRDQSLEVYLQSGGPETVVLFSPQNKEQRLSYYLSEYGIEFLFHPTDFTQVNREINQKLIRQALELLNPKPNESFLDLFCGIGNFTLPLARFSKQVIGLEGSPVMVDRARENAAHNNVLNVDFQCMNLANNSYNNSWNPGDFDGILLDPPRTGALEMMHFIAEKEINKVVYISCNPATLARDAGQLSQYGYELETIGVLDMFPHTSHVESIALFKSRG